MKCRGKREPVRLTLYIISLVPLVNSSAAQNTLFFCNTKYLMVAQPRSFIESEKEQAMSSIPVALVVQFYE